MKTFILIYVLRDKFAEDTDHYEVFCDDSKEDNLLNAEQRLSEIQDIYYESDTKLYSWNIAQIISTSEHYE